MDPAKKEEACSIFQVNNLCKDGPFELPLPLTHQDSILVEIAE